MATKERRTAREIRLEAIVELQNELNKLTGMEPVNESYLLQYEDYKLYELGAVKESLAKQIEHAKHQNKVDAFYAGEGKELFAEIERRKEAIRQNFKSIEDRMSELAENYFAGTPWHVTYKRVSYGQAIISTVLHNEEGKELFGTDIEIRYERNSYRRNNERFTTNIGTCGSNDILDDSIGSRTFFYIQVGEFLKNQSKLKVLRDELSKLVDEYKETDSKWHHVQNVLANPFTKTLEDESDEED